VSDNSANVLPESPQTLRIGDHTVRRLGFGAMRISGARNANGVRDREEARALVRAAVEGGVNFIDTADIYGYGESEEIIAEAIHPYADDLLIATKAGFFPGKVLPGHVTLPPKGDPKHIKEACEGSLRRLRLDVIDLYQIHVPDPTIPFADTIGAFVELQNEGKIRHIGISNVTASQLSFAQQLCTVVSVQNRYNAGDRVSDDVLDACESQGIAFLPYSPMMVQNQKAVTEIAAIAQKHGVLAQNVSLQWLLHRSPVMLPIPGTSQMAHLQENLQALSFQLSSGELARLDELL
jgi:pyridoxine 4-dehydrogenase